MKEKAKKQSRLITRILCVMAVLWMNVLPAAAQEALELHVENYRSQENQLQIYVNDTADKAEYTLSPDNFDITLGGMPLACTDVARFSGTGEPVSYIFLVDVSGSINGEKLQNMKNYLKTVTEKLQAADQVCLITMGDTLRVGEFTSGKSAINEQIDQIEGLSEDTNLYYGIVESLKLLDSKAGDSSKKALLVLSDGHDDQTTGITREEVNRYLEKTRIPVYTAAMLDEWADSSAQEFAKILGSFARLSAGGIHTTFGVDDTSMEESASRIAESISNSLVLTADLSGYEKGNGQAYLQVTMSVDGLGTASDGYNIPEKDLEIILETEMSTEAATEEITEAETVTEEITEAETITEEITEEETITEEVTETEAITELRTEKAAETEQIMETENVTEKITESETEEITETGKITESETEEITEAPTERESETEKKGGYIEVPGIGSIPIAAAAAAAAILLLVIIIAAVAASRKKKQQPSNENDGEDSKADMEDIDDALGEHSSDIALEDIVLGGHTSDIALEDSEKEEEEAQEDPASEAQPEWRPEGENEPEDTGKAPEEQAGAQPEENQEAQETEPDAVIYLTRVGLSEESTYTIQLRGEVTLGRQPQSVNYAFPEDGHMSALHCSLMYSNGKVILRDKNSKNGTRVNGVPITAPYELHCDDVIRIGRTELRVHW